MDTGYCPVARFEANTRGRDFVVGDIHGSFELLYEALAAAAFDPSRDRLFCTGDLIDRGPSSHLVRFFLEFPFVHSVCGNHENMLLELYALGEPDPEELRAACSCNGLSWWLSVDPGERLAILDALRKLPFAIEIQTPRGTAGIIHADVPQGLDWQTFCRKIEQFDPPTLHACIWGRGRVERADLSGVAGIGRVFAGHTPQWGGPARFANVFVIDTGAVFGLLGACEFGHITLAELMACTAAMDAPRQNPEPLFELKTGASGLPFSGAPGSPATKHQP